MHIFFNKLVPLTKMPTRFEIHESQFGKQKKPFTTTNLEFMKISVYD